MFVAVAGGGVLRAVVVGYEPNGCELVADSLCSERDFCERTRELFDDVLHERFDVDDPVVKIMHEWAVLHHVRYFAGRTEVPREEMLVLNMVKMRRGELLLQHDRRRARRHRLPRVVLRPRQFAYVATHDQLHGGGASCATSRRAGTNAVRPYLWV